MSQRASRSKNTWYFAVAAAVAVLIVAIFFLIDPPGALLIGVIRAAALLGYLGVFASIVSSLYLRELVRFFGRSFVQVHHYVSVTSLVLLVIHPAAVATLTGTLAVFVPDFSSLRGFFTNGGRAAWWLLALASLAALLRARFKNEWRPVHYLTYVAFWLATAHGILLGGNLGYLVVQIIAIAMALFTLYILIQKRLAKPKGRPSAGRRG